MLKVEFIKFIFQILRNILTTSAKKRDKVSMFCSVFLGATQKSILCSVFLLIYIKSNHIVSTVKKLAADDILFFIAMLKS